MQWYLKLPQPLTSGMQEIKKTCPTLIHLAQDCWQWLAAALQSLTCSSWLIPVLPGDAGEQIWMQIWCWYWMIAPPLLTLFRCPWEWRNNNLGYKAMHLLLLRIPGTFLSQDCSVTCAVHSSLNKVQTHLSDNNKKATIGRTLEAS